MAEEGLELEPMLASSRGRRKQKCPNFEWGEMGFPINSTKIDGLLGFVWALI